MPASHIAWSYAARTCLSISEGWAKSNYSDPPVADLPRIMCATLLFLRASHEAYSDEQDIPKPDLEPRDMVAFVWFAKNSIIHHSERISMVPGAPITAPQGLLAFQIAGFEIDFDGPAAQRAAKEPERLAAKRYANRRAERGVQGGLLAEIWDAVQDTADMLDVPAKLREQFDKSGVPIILTPDRAPPFDVMADRGSPRRESF